jgi:hypothetical protein
MTRLILQVVYLWRHVSSTAPPFILWWSNLEILFGPLHRIALSLHRRAALSSNSNWTRSLHSRENPKRSLYCEMSVYSPNKYSTYRTAIQNYCIHEQLKIFNNFSDLFFSKITERQSFISILKEQYVYGKRIWLGNGMYKALNMCNWIALVLNKSSIDLP